MYLIPVSSQEWTVHFGNFHIGNCKTFFCQKGSRESLNWSGLPKILQRHQRSNIEHIILSKDYEKKQFKLFEKSSSKKHWKQTILFFKVLVFWPMVYIGQSKLSIRQKYPKNVPNCFRSRTQLEPLLTLWAPSLQFILGMYSMILVFQIF